MNANHARAWRLVPGAIAALAGTAMAVPPAPFPATFELSALDGDNGFVIRGVNASDVTGRSVSSAGDVNGDGYGDLIIGAPYADPDGQSFAGESYVVFGGPGVGASGSINLSALDGTNGFAVRGFQASSGSGWSVSSAGDINTDGYDDLIIGAPGAEPNGLYAAGESYVVFGGAGVGASGSINLSALNGANGFVMSGIQAFSTNGTSVSSAGDVNGDGIDDLIIGANGATPNGRSGAGESYIVFGRSTGFAASLDLSALTGTNGFVVGGIDANDNCGFSVSSAGDINGDGIDDLIIGARSAESNGPSGGESYVVFGRNTLLGKAFPASFNLLALTGTNGFVLRGIDTIDRSGFAVSSAGDVNGDGIGDLIIAAPYADPNGQSQAGESYVVFGTDTGFAPSLNLSDLNGANGFVINGIDANDRSGCSVASAGDVNGDGVDDIIIGAFLADPNGQSAAGESYVVFGSPGVGAAGSINLSALNGANGFVVNGIHVADRSGSSVSSAGDVNGDGIGDLIIGAYGAESNGNPFAGESYVVFGRAPAPSCAGDITGDGYTNSADFNVLASNFGAGPGATLGMGDITGDGYVNSADFNVLAGDFGCTP